jgi:putative DNA primase/helicase
VQDTTSQFHDAIRATGLQPPDVIIPGKYHRFPGIGKRKANKAGWCKLFNNCMGGCFGDFSSGLSESWQAKLDRKLTDAERATFRCQIEEARAQADETEMKNTLRQRRGRNQYGMRQAERVKTILI